MGRAAKAVASVQAAQAALRGAEARAEPSERSTRLVGARSLRRPGGTFPSPRREAHCSSGRSRWWPKAVASICHAQKKRTRSSAGGGTCTSELCSSLRATSHTTPVTAYTDRVVLSPTRRTASSHRRARRSRRVIVAPTLYRTIARSRDRPPLTVAPNSGLSRTTERVHSGHLASPTWGPPSTPGCRCHHATKQSVQKRWPHCVLHGSSGVERQMAQTSSSSAAASPAVASAASRGLVRRRWSQTR